VKIFSLLGYAIALVAVGIFIYLAAATPVAFTQIALNKDTIFALSASLLLYAAAIGVGGSVWFVLLRAVGQRVGWGEALTIVWVSQAAKYVPGNVAQHVGRLVLARKRGIDANAAFFTMIVEIAWLVGVASVLALVFLLTFGDDFLDGTGLAIGHWVLPVLAVFAVVTPLIGHR